MLPRDRVKKVIRHERPDRIPLYGWVKWNMESAINERFGSTEILEDHYEFDFAHLFGGPYPFAFNADEMRKNLGRPLEPGDILDAPLSDPDNKAAYENLLPQIKHHGEERGRFLYVQTGGIFEPINGLFGIENHLLYLMMYENELKQLYRRLAEWNAGVNNNLIDMGIDMIHVSDDWGAQKSLMFSPDTWWNLIYPNHKIFTDAVKRRGAFLSLHSDGNVRDVLDGIVKLGYDVVHPYQESAGMDYDEYWEKYSNDFVIMGGLDVQSTLGFGNYDFLRSEIERVMRTFADGGLLFCTTHFVQNHCTIDELVFAYDTAYELSRQVCRQMV